MVSGVSIFLRFRIRCKDASEPSNMSVVQSLERWLFLYKYFHYFKLERESVSASQECPFLGACCMY